MRATAVSFVAGLVFALGLGIGGMTQPAKVIGFLDFFGHWDPSLAFVMGGAIAVYATVWRIVRRRPVAIGGAALQMPGDKAVDARMLIGSAIFGIGWGLGGFCPGPALVSLVSAVPGVIAFTLAMAAGLLAFKAVDKYVQARVL